jgi:hypothetical protein
MNNLSRLDLSYHLEVRKFIDAARRHACTQKTKYIHCPCIDCKNVVVFEDAEEISSHLICRGFMKDYLIRMKHGEVSLAPFAQANPVHVDGQNLDDGTQHHGPQSDPVMVDHSDDDDDDVGSKMHVKTLAKLELAKVNKQSFLRHCCTVIQILQCSLSKEWRH